MIKYSDNENDDDYGDRVDRFIETMFMAYDGPKTFTVDELMDSAENDLDFLRAVLSTVEDVTSAEGIVAVSPDEPFDYPFSDDDDDNEESFEIWSRLEYGLTEALK